MFCIKLEVFFNQILSKGLLISRQSMFTDIISEICVKLKLELDFINFSILLELLVVNI